MSQLKSILRWCRVVKSPKVKLWKPHKMAYSVFVNQQTTGIRSIHTLYELLTYLRRAGSAQEEAFVKQLRLLLPTSAYRDSFGNLIVDIGANKPKTLFSCHTDSVCFQRQFNRQTLDITDNAAIKSAEANQLGSDDGAGIWLLLNMIDAEVPGRYIFHRAEEIGGHGSLHIKYYESKLLVGIENAIAFDRRGTRSVITHMLFQRCCSDRFAQALCDAIGMSHVLDQTGGFTDVENYIDAISNCTNISVGYMNEHSTTEYLNVAYLERLRDQLLKVDWLSLAEMENL